MKNTLYITLFLLCGFVAEGQQLPYTSQLNNTDFIWNPAQTAVGTKMNTSGFFRQQWLGFKGAPRTAFIGVEYPMVKSNMSIGGALISDQTGPVSKLGAHLTYSYKLEEILKRDDQLSFGISANFSQFSFDPTDQEVNETDDLLLANSRESQFYPSIGAGVFYTNNTRDFYDNAFYFGIAGSQVYATDILLQEGNFNRAMHWFGTVGLKFYNYSSLIEPSVNVNVVNGELIDLMLNVNYELEEKFWAGIGYSSSTEVSFQGGAIFPDLLQRYSELRIGALANLGLGDGRISNFGPGFELVVSYLYDLD